MMRNSNHHELLGNPIINPTPDYPRNYQPQNCFECLINFTRFQNDHTCATSVIRRPQMVVIRPPSCSQFDNNSVTRENFQNFQNFGQNCQTEYTLRILENNDGECKNEATEFERNCDQNPSKSAQIERNRNIEQIIQGLKRGWGRPGLDEKRPNEDLNGQSHWKEEKKYKMSGSGGMAFLNSTLHGTRKRGRPRKIVLNVKSSSIKFEDNESKSIYSDISEDEAIPTKKNMRLIEEISPRYTNIPESSSYSIYNGNHTRAGVIVENPSKIPSKIGVNSPVEISEKFPGKIFNQTFINLQNPSNTKITLLGVENPSNPSLKIGTNLPEIPTNLKISKISSNFIYKAVENPHIFFENISKKFSSGENFAKMYFQTGPTLPKTSESPKNAENRSQDLNSEFFENPPKLISEVLENQSKNLSREIFDDPPKLCPMISPVTLPKFIEKIDKNLGTDSTKTTQNSPKSPSLLTVNPENIISFDNEVPTIKNISKSPSTCQSFEPVLSTMPDIRSETTSLNDKTIEKIPKNSKPIFVSTGSVIYRNNALPFSLRIRGFSNNLQIEKTTENPQICSEKVESENLKIVSNKVESVNLKISSEKGESENSQICSEKDESENMKIASKKVESENMKITSEKVESPDKSRKEIEDPAEIELIELSDTDSDSDLEPDSDDEDSSEIFNLGSFLFQDKKFTDIDLSVGDQIFKVHRAVLASQSSYFSSFFEESYSYNSREGWSFPEVKPDIFKLILNFIYKGENPQILNNEILIDILELGMKFQIKKLIKICKTHLVKVKDFEPQFGIKLLEIIIAEYSAESDFLDSIVQLVKPIYKDIKKLPIWKDMVQDPKFFKVLQKLMLILDK